MAPGISPEKYDDIKSEIEGKASKTLRRLTYAWKPVEYDEDAAHAYLLAKAPYDYACMKTIMDEIKARDPNFQPRTLFDCGSGVGTSIW